MDTTARYQVAVIVLAAALVASLTSALTGGDPADAVDGPVDVVYVATGRNFPDALAGSILASTVGAPLLTVESAPPLPAATIAALTSLDPDRIIVFGGPAAVSDQVVKLLEPFARSGSVTRIEGGDRHETAGLIADALPDKVHDADLLDGLDASEFLRSNADIDADMLDGLDASDFLRSNADVDAATLDGVAAEDLRIITLDLGAVFLGGNTVQGNHSVNLLDSGTSLAYWNTVMPFDRRDAPLSLHLLVSSIGAPVACQMNLEVLAQITPNADGTTQQFEWVVENGTDPTTYAFGGNTRVEEIIVAPVDPPPIVGGVAIAFDIARNGDLATDNCPNRSIKGGYVTY